MRDDRAVGMGCIVAIVCIAVAGAVWGVDSKVPELAIAAIAGFVTGRGAGGGVAP